MPGGVVSAVKSALSPDTPDVKTPDPVAEESALGAAQAEERAARSRKGLQSTRVVKQSLLKQKGRETFGGSAQ